MRHQWNTGRHYDKHGQRMVAEYHSDKNRIFFSDLSRNINGYVPTGVLVNTDKRALEVLVMTNYDYGNYNGNNNTLEWKEGMNMTHEQLHEAADYLETKEGGFANAIALAYYRADSDNRRKLVEAFGNLFERAYAKWHKE